MKHFLLAAFVLVGFNTLPNVCIAADELNRTAFYHALASEKIDEVESMLGNIEKMSFPEKDAFEGALLMKKAGLMKDKKLQLRLFKEGKDKLEKEIVAYNQNCEYRILRLMIQENAPKFLGYNKDITGDCNFIKENYKKTLLPVQHQVMDYSQHSKNLKLS